MSNSRFSVIPAAAIADLVSEPRCLLVLCTFGKHTDNNGWCFRSQVKMASELKIARSTLQAAIDRLVELGWLEKHHRTHKEGGFAACAYRVLLDKQGCQNDGEGAVHTGTPPDTVTGGLPVHRAGGADTCIGTFNDESNDIKRESAGAEKFDYPEKRKTADDGLACDGRAIEAFMRAWPSGAVDCADKTQRAWAALSPVERAAAIDGVGDYERECRRMGRKTRHAGSTYLSQKMWIRIQKLGDGSVNSDTPITLSVWSKEWWAAGLARIERGDVRKAAVMFKLGFDGTVKTTVVNGAECASNEQIAALRSFPIDGEVVGRWESWFERHGIRFPSGKSGVWVFLPSDNPPDVGASVWGV